MADLTQNVETLIRKAAAAEKSEDAMRFSQAALNATNALSGLTYLPVMAAEAERAKANDQQAEQGA